MDYADLVASLPDWAAPALRWAGIGIAVNGTDAMFGIVTLGWIVLIASSLAARRIPLKQGMKMALAWVAIFTVGFTLFVFRGEFSAVGSRMKSELLGTPMVEGSTIRIPIAEDGHYLGDRRSQWCGGAVSHR